MKYKVGDKVKFLNDVGGGVIKKILSPTLVEVAVEDGFDLPVPVNEIIMAQSQDIKASVFNQDFNIPVSQSVEKEEENTAKELNRMSKLQKFTSLHHQSQGVYLAYVPHDQIWLTKDDVDLFLVNYTNFDLLYVINMLNETNTYTHIDHGCLEPQSKILVKTLTREELEKNLRGIVQILWYKDENEMIYAPANKEFKISSIHFVQPEEFKTCNFLGERSYLYLVGRPMIEDVLEKQVNKENKKIE